MKTVKRTQMKGFEGGTLAEFVNDFNRKMEWVAKFASIEEERDIDLANLRGYVIYTEVVQIPENYRDRLDLANLRVSCGQCKHFNPTRYSWGECPYCKGDLRKADECCERFFNHWEEGDCWLTNGEEEYEYAIKQIDLDAVRKGA